MVGLGNLVSPLRHFGRENFECECFDIEYFVYEVVYHILTWRQACLRLKPQADIQNPFKRIREHVKNTLSVTTVYFTMPQKCLAITIIGHIMPAKGE